MPILTLKSYCKVISSLNPSIIDNFLLAAGLEAGKLDGVAKWEDYIRLNCLLKYGTAPKKEYTQFFIRVFDPK